MELRNKERSRSQEGGGSTTFGGKSGGEHSQPKSLISEEPSYDLWAEVVGKQVI